MSKFDLGTVVMTRGVQAALESHPEGKGLQELEHIILNRHAKGDWGDLDEHDLRMNEDARLSKVELQIEKLDEHTRRPLWLRLLTFK